MKTIICNFKSDGKDIRKTAILNDCLTELSKSKRNEATDILEPGYPGDNIWGIVFEVTETLSYEVNFKYKEYQKTLEPVKAITWDGSRPDNVTITDVQKLTVTVK